MVLAESPSSRGRGAAAAPPWPVSMPGARRNAGLVRSGCRVRRPGQVFSLDVGRRLGRHSPPEEPAAEDGPPESRRHHGRRDRDDRLLVARHEQREERNGSHRDEQRNEFRERPLAE